MSDELKESGKTVYKFSAIWCGPCKALAPTFKKVSEEYPEANIINVDIDDNPELAQKFKVKSIPCIVFVEDGEEKNRLIGRVLIDALRKAFRDHF